MIYSGHPAGPGTALENVMLSEQRLLNPKQLWFAPADFLTTLFPSPFPLEPFQVVLSRPAGVVKAVCRWHRCHGEVWLWSGTVICTLKPCLQWLCPTGTSVLPWWEHKQWPNCCHLKAPNRQVVLWWHGHGKQMCPFHYWMGDSVHISTVRLHLILCMQENVELSLSKQWSTFGSPRT